MTRLLVNLWAPPLSRLVLTQRTEIRLRAVRILGTKIPDSPRHSTGDDDHGRKQDRDAELTALDEYLDSTELPRVVAITRERLGDRQDLLCVPE